MPALIDTLASYVPGLITNRLAAEPVPITTPRAESFPAAVLFADISGFTNLAERLARSGPTGTEELTRLLNTYFGRLIDLVTVYGGDVVKFAGDGLLAFWPAIGSNGNSLVNSPGLHSAQAGQGLDIATCRATQCALAVQTTLLGYEAGGGVPLALRLNIGAGEVLVMHLGGVYGRSELLVTGSPLSQIKMIDRHTQPGQVSLSREAWALVQDKCVGQPLSPNTVRLDAVHEPLPLRPAMPLALTSTMETALRPYIPAAILSRLSAGQTGWLAELRRVTTIFVNLPDLSHTTPLAEAQAAMLGLQTALYRYEGSINKLNVDNKGITLVAALGLPPLSHRDDPIRGVQAALTMRANMKTLGVRCAIGVTSGLVFCGSVGTVVRREYTLIGDAVNLAARLMEAAPDDILCDAATYEAAKADLVFETLKPITVRGKTGSIAIYRPLGRKHKSQISKPATPRRQIRQTKIIGRTEEREFLAQQLQTLLDDTSGNVTGPQVVVIEGSAGIGKSQLVVDLLDQAQALNVASLVGTGSAIEKSTPYHVWRPVFGQLFALEKLSDDAAMRARQVLAQLESKLVWSEPPSREDGELDRLEMLSLAPLLNAVLPLNLPDNELTAQMSGEVRAENTRELLVCLLQVAAEQAPTLLVLEDAHWLDSASWALIHRVSRDVCPLLLVVTTRPPDESSLIAPDWRGVASSSLLTREAYHQFLETHGVQRLRLEALALKDALELVCQRLNVTTLSKPVATLIMEKAEGHPFFSEELGYMLRDADLIKISNRVCQLTTDVSATPTDFSRSDPVQTAQVLNGLDLPDTVEGAITSRIDRLTPSQQLTLKVASVIGRIFAFQVLHDIHPVELDKPELPTHIDTLERRDIVSLETPDPELAYFFKHTITQQVIHGQMTVAQRRQLHRSAADWYERTYAQNLSPFYPLLAYHWSQAEVVTKAIDYLEQAGEQAVRSGAYQEAVDFFSQALALDGEQWPSTRGTGKRTKTKSALFSLPACPPAQLRRARWERLLGEAYFGLGNLTQSRQHLEQAVALLGCPVPAGRISLVVGLVGQVLQQAGPTKFSNGAPETMREAARAYEQLAHIAYFAQDKILGSKAVLRALNLAEAAGASPELARSYANMSVVAGLITLHPQAEAYSHRARTLARSLDQPAVLAWVLFITSVYDVGVGRWSEVERALDESVKIFKDLKDRRNLAESVSLMAMAASFRGQFRRSVELYADIYKAASRRGDAQARAWGLVGQAVNLWRLGQSEKIVILLKRALSLLPKNVDHADEIRSYGILALAYLRQGKQLLALQAAEAAGHWIRSSSPAAVAAFEGYASVAEVYLACWEAGPNGDYCSVGQETLAKSAQKACKSLRAFAFIFPIAQPRAWLWQGLYEWLAGKPAKAHKAWQKSLATAEQLAMPYEQGLAHYEIGRHLPLDDPTRQEHLSCACEIYTRLDASYDLDRAREALAAQE